MRFYQKLALAALLTAAVIFAQDPAKPVGLPVIGAIDYYGFNRVSRETVRKTLNLKEGDTFPASKAATEEALLGIAGMAEAHLEAVCCTDEKLILYVGVEERGAAHFEVRDSPEGEIVLPEAVTLAYRKLLQAKKGETAEDITQGYSLSADPDARALQLEFPALVKAHAAALREVLRSSFDVDQRMTAVALLAYNPNKREAVSDLQTGLRDADASVRAAAAQALVAQAVFAKLHPQERLIVQPTWFVEMLNSLSWTDRYQALKALQVLTESREPSVLGLLRERALPALAEMARWRTLDHALPAFILLGRLAGTSEEKIQDAWVKGDRDAIISAAGKRSK